MPDWKRAVQVLVAAFAMRRPSFLWPVLVAVVKRASRPVMLHFLGPVRNCCGGGGGGGGGDDMGVTVDWHVVGSMGKVSR